MKPEYNILQKAGSLLGFKHSEESRTKMSSTKTGKKHSEETLAKMKERKHSEETRAKMSITKIGAHVGEKHPMFGKKHSEETLAKLAAAQKDKCQKIEVTDLTLNQTTKYESMTAAALALGIKHSQISTYFRRNQKNPYQGRYIFKKV